MPDSRQERDITGQSKGVSGKEPGTSSGSGRKIEKEKWALLGLIFLVAGAAVLGMLTHAESLEVRDAMKDIKIIISEETGEFGES